MEIALIAGTRPEVIKMLPVYLALRGRAGVTPRLVMTGQHRELAQDVLRLFDVEPDHDMQVMQPGQTLPMLAHNLAAAFACYLHDHPPDIILVQGDTTSAMMGGMFGFYHGIPVGHIEAGLRTGNLQAPFPEEFNRRVVTLASRWHFTPTQRAAENLRREGITQEVYVVGNTVIDAVRLIAQRDTDEVRRLQAQFAFLNTPEKIATVLVTAHRRENFGDGIRNIATAIKALAAARPQVQFILPVHPNPNVRPVFTAMLQGQANIHLTEPMGYDALLYVMRQSRLILTDSGGIQEEAPTFHVPVLVLRQETERPEGIAAGCSRLVGTDAATIQRAFFELMDHPEIYRNMATAKNPYGDGHAAERIADCVTGAG